MADVLIYLVGLADSLGLDLLAAASAKLDAAANRFPTEEHFGRAPEKR